MTPLAFALDAPRSLFDGLVSALQAQVGELHRHRFPDGESGVRVGGDCAGRHTLLVCTLNDPDAKLLPLLFAADTLRDLGAASVGLVAPYLAYMRQDKRFAPGEGITGRYFGAIVSPHIDWLATVDPHLHRFASLDEVYSVPARAVRAAPAIAAWLQANVPDALLIGPDSESEQWVSEVAQLAGCPSLVLEKVRSGDREVAVSVPDVEGHGARTPVLIDDIVSTGATLVATIRHLREAGLPAPVCVVTHGVFASGALSGLRSAGAARVVSCNTIDNDAATIDVATLLATACRELQQRQPIVAAAAT